MIFFVDVDVLVDVVVAQMALRITQAKNMDILVSCKSFENR
jgi:hypothetical protein